MLNTIRSKLREIESRENVRILHCVESGSRAWGFSSPDSDYDVRFIYARPRDFYLRLDEQRDVIEWQLDETLDINGWDISKALRLLYKSNPTLFEWNSSPIIYKTTQSWSEVSAIINDYFVKKSGMHHYLSMARHNYREFLQGERVRLKKYFYVLRPVLACMWIIKHGTPPPMLFDELKRDCLDVTVLPFVDDLLAKKRETSELGEGERIDVINDYLDESIQKLTDCIARMPDEPHGSWDKLNELFLRIINT